MANQFDVKAIEFLSYELKMENYLFFASPCTLLYEEKYAAFYSFF